MNKIDLFGYDDFFRDSFQSLKRDDLIPGRIATENKNNYVVFTEQGDITSEVCGSLMFASESKINLPKVGDWVALAVFGDLGIIHHVLKRKTVLSRKMPDNKTEEQIIACNLDVVFIMQSADNNFNLNRMERQVIAIHNSSAKPAVILSKIDCCDDFTNYISEIDNRLNNIDIFPISSLNNTGIDNLQRYLVEGNTYTILGSSGVGKSTLINKLYGEEILKTNKVRESDLKGKHTTTRREMIQLPSGGIIIDMPGMREFGLWEDSNGIAATYPEFHEYKGKCRYSDCSHTVENDCAVIIAVRDGKISEDKYRNYLKLRKELSYLETKVDEKKALEKKRKWKNIKKESRRMIHKGKNNH